MMRTTASSVRPFNVFGMLSLAAKMILRPNRDPTGLCNQPATFLIP